MMTLLPAIALSIYLIISFVVFIAAIGVMAFEVHMPIHSKIYYVMSFIISMIIGILWPITVPVIMLLKRKGKI